MTSMGNPKVSLKGVHLGVRKKKKKGIHKVAGYCEEKNLRFFSSLFSKMQL